MCAIYTFLNTQQMDYWLQGSRPGCGSCAIVAVQIGGGGAGAGQCQKVGYGAGQ